MQEFFQFVIQHWFLSLTFIALLAILVRLESEGMSGGMTALTPQETTDKLNKENAILVDTRPEEDFKSGHILNARNIPFDQLEEKLKKLNKFKQKPVIICATSPQEVGKVGQLFKAQAFEHLFTLRGGLDAWKEANFPLEKA